MKPLNLLSVIAFFLLTLLLYFSGRLLYLMYHPMYQTTKENYTQYIAGILFSAIIAILYRMFSRAAKGKETNTMPLWFAGLLRRLQ